MTDIAVFTFDCRSNLLKEVRFQLDLVAAQVRQGRGLCHKLNKLIGPPVASVNLSAGPAPHAMQ